ncbi:hypothetical protein PSTT_14637, partial [Puccinia striiformis]
AYLTVARGQPFTDFISHVQSNSPDPPLSPPSGSDSVIINERALTLTTRPFSKLHTVNSSFRSSSTVADCKPWHHSDHLGKPSSAQPPALPDSKGNLVPSEVATSPCCQNRPIVIRGESQHSVRLSSLASLPTRSRLLPPPSALSTVIPSADQSPGLAIASTFVPRPEAHVVSTTTPTAIATQTQDHLTVSPSPTISTDLPINMIISNTHDLSSKLPIIDVESSATTTTTTITTPIVTPRSTDIPPTPVQLVQNSPDNLPTTTIRAMSMLNEEQMSTLEHQVDPRY